MDLLTKLLRTAVVTEQMAYPVSSRSLVTNSRYLTVLGRVHSRVSPPSYASRPWLSEISSPPQRQTNLILPGELGLCKSLLTANGVLMAVAMLLLCGA